MNATSRIDIIDQLRGIAALSVAWYHFGRCRLIPTDSWIHWSGTYGWLGVEVFFVISGFIIPYSLWRGGYDPHRHFGAFLLKRIVRLDPPYLVALMVTVLIGTAVAAARGRDVEVSLPQLAAHLGYLNAIIGYKWIVGFYWTLAIEFQFYIVAALIFPLVSHERRATCLGVLAAMASVGYLFPSEDFVFRYGGLFALGAAAFQARKGTWGIAAHLALTAALSLAVWHRLGAPHAAAGCSTALLIAYARPRRSALLAYFGAISYSVYLLHAPFGMTVGNALSRIADSPAERLVGVAIMFALTIAVAHLLYRFVELPSQRWSSSVKFRRADEAAPPVAARLADAMLPAPAAS